MKSIFSIQLVGLAALAAADYGRPWTPGMACPDFVDGYRATDWCEKPGEAGAIWHCTPDRIFNPRYDCDGICDNNAGHAVCRDSLPCDGGMEAGDRTCKNLGGPQFGHKDILYICNSDGNLDVLEKCEETGGVCNSFNGGGVCFREGENPPCRESMKKGDKLCERAADSVIRVCNNDRLLVEDGHCDGICNDNDWQIDCR